MTFTVELEREEDGRWIAEVTALPGVLCYGRDRDEAVAGVQALALRVIAERLENREEPAESAPRWGTYLSGPSCIESSRHSQPARRASCGCMSCHFLTIPVASRSRLRQLMSTVVSNTTNQRSTFQWKRSLESWDLMAGLMEPFVVKGTDGGFQYLNDSEGPEVIYSTRRA